MDRADFYLASAEGYGLETPRRCKALRRLAGDNGNDYLLIEIEPPLIHQVSSLASHELKQVVVATRHQGDTLFPIKRWPVYVHIGRLLAPCDGRDTVEVGQIETIAWGELYESEQAAVEKQVHL